MSTWKLHSLFIVSTLLFLAVSPCLQITTSQGNTLEDQTVISQDQEEKITKSLSSMAGWFTENQGQYQNPNVLYTYGNPGFFMCFLQGGYEVHLPGENGVDRILSVSFGDAHPIQPVGHDPLEHRSNYFIGNDPSHWQRQVPIYEKLVYEGLYEGIDLVFSSSGQSVKYDFIVAPGANPDQISFRWFI